MKTDDERAATPDADDDADADAKTTPEARIKSVILTFRVIEELALAGEPIGVSELARRIGEAKARIHRHLLTLRDLGVLAQDKGSERYLLGWKLFQLGQAAANQSDIQSIAEPHMRRLRDATKLTVMLSLPAGDEMIVAHTVESEASIVVTVRKGLRLPAHGSAHGRLMLAFASPATVNRILARPLRRMTPETLIDPALVRERLAKCRRALLESANNETSYGVNALAAPILNHSDELAAAVGIIGTQAQIKHPADPGQIQSVRGCAQAISAALGSDYYVRVGADPGGPMAGSGAEQQRATRPRRKKTDRAS